MAYFPNGTAGMILDEQCDECLHGNPESACPLAFAQMNFNYEQCGNALAEKILNSLVNKDGKCLMKPATEKHLKSILIGPQDMDCDHEWVHVGEQVVEDAEMCLNCKAIRKKGQL